MRCLVAVSYFAAEAIMRGREAMHYSIRKARNLMQNESASKRIVLVFLSLLFSCLLAQAAVIANYTFGTASPGSLASSDGEPISTAGNIVAGSSLSGSGPANIGNPAWAYTMVKGNLSTSQDLNAYLSFTITTIGGLNKLMLNGATIVFEIASGQTGKTVNWGVRTSVSGFGNPNIAGGSTSSTTFSPIPTITLSGSGYDNLTSIEFRIYGWQNGSGNNVDISFDNIILNGTVVPEPVSTAIAGFGILAALIQGARMTRRRFASPPGV
jgi:hypothetical protein